MKEVFDINNGTLKYKNKYILFIFIFYMYIFQDFIAKYISIFKYFDELYAILFFPIVLFKILNRKSKLNMLKEDFAILICLIIIIIAGITSNIIFKYQNIFGIITDILLFIKFFLTFYTTLLIFKDANLEKYKKKISNHCKVIVCILFIIMILSYIFNWYDIGERYGIKIIQLFYSHPTVLVSNCLCLFALIFLCDKDEHRWDNLISMFMLIILMASTLRVKAIANIGVIFILYIIIIKWKKKIDLKKILLIAIIVVTIAFNQLYFYLVKGSDFARTVLMKTSVEIAYDYFPLGTGFGTFASYVSGVQYSPIYEKYGIEHIYGLEEGYAPYVSDTFWPMILGQFGVVGGITYCIIILAIFMKIQKLYGKGKISEYFVAMILLTYLMIASTAESAFVNPMAMPMAFLMGILEQESYKERKEKSNEQ